MLIYKIQICLLLNTLSFHLVFLLIIYSIFLLFVCSRVCLFVSLFVHSFVRWLSGLFSCSLHSPFCLFVYFLAFLFFFSLVYSGIRSFIVLLISSLNIHPSISLSIHLFRCFVIRLSKKHVLQQIYKDFCLKIISQKLFFLVFVRFSFANITVKYVLAF